MQKQDQVFKILVPLALDDRIEDQIAYAERFASHLRADIHYLHVVPTTSDISNGIEATPREYDLLENDTLHTLRRRVTNALEQCRHSPYSNPSLTFREGESIAATVLEEAASKKCDLILCRASEISYRFLPSAFSTVISIMNHSTIPVIVTPPNNCTAFEKGRFSIVIADDLSDKSSAAVKWAITLSSRMHECHIYHIHVEPLNREQFIATFYANAADCGIPIMVDCDLGLIYDQKIEGIKQNLEIRLMQLGLDGLVDRAKYETHLLSGKVRDAVAHESQIDFADLVVFGRHQFIHTHPIALGKISYRSMLEQKRPLAIVPYESPSAEDEKVLDEEYVEENISIHY